MEYYELEDIFEKVTTSCQVIEGEIDVLIHACEDLNIDADLGPKIEKIRSTVQNVYDDMRNAYEDNKRNKTSESESEGDD